MTKGLHQEGDGGFGVNAVFRKKVTVGRIF
jgi:hypothetical protein